MNPSHMPRPHNPPHSAPVNTGADWPAYPVTEDSYHEPSRGLTKRELFSAMAMQGALGGAPGSHLHPYNLANESVMYADALLAELAKDAAQGGKSYG